jgi:hypothetical protein
LILTTAYEIHPCAQVRRRGSTLMIPEGHVDLESAGYTGVHGSHPLADSRGFLDTLGIGEENLVFWLTRWLRIGRIGKRNGLGCIARIGKISSKKGKFFS